MKSKSLLKLIFSLTFILSIIQNNNKITQKNGQFIDENGLTRIFHGVNVVVKLPPYIPSSKKFDPLQSLNFQEDMKYLKKFGFTLVRLGITWEAIEKSENEFDLELLNKYFNLVEELGKNGIYTIIDAHQDVLSRLTCGEGIPVFYAQSANPEQTCDSSLFKRFLHFMGICKPFAEYGYSTDEHGLPRIEECAKRMFAYYSLGPEFSSLYKKLYDNENGLLDKFINFWKVLAKKFKDSEYILGYNVWNEPAPGGLYDTPLSLLFPARANDKQLLPFYRALDFQIRKIDPEYTLMFEPNAWPDFIPLIRKNMEPDAFSEAPLRSKALSQKQAYNYHSYCCAAGDEICSSGEPLLQYAEKCRKFHFENARVANAYAEKFGFAALLTEFGACYNSDACAQEINSVADAADAALNSWAYWMYKPFNDFTTTCKDQQEGLFEADGKIQEKKVGALTRAYVTAFQGKPVLTKFFVQEKILVFEFKMDLSLNARTRVYYFKEMHYKQGIKLLSTFGNVKVENAEENYLELEFGDNKRKRNDLQVGENNNESNDIREKEKDELYVMLNGKRFLESEMNNEDETIMVLLAPKDYDFSLDGGNEDIKNYFEQRKLKVIYED